MDATTKHPAISAFLASINGGRDREQYITDGQCVTCDATGVVEFLRDDRSRNEYCISGMCQQCQDTTFLITDDE